MRIEEPADDSTTGDESVELSTRQPSGTGGASLNRNSTVGIVFKGFFPSTEVETFAEQSSYGLTQLVGEMGGTIGLFLGFSFLSIHVGIEAVTMAVAWALYKAKPVTKRGDLAWIVTRMGKSRPSTPKTLLDRIN
jgi:hypothetical protein